MAEQMRFKENGEIEIVKEEMVVEEKGRMTADELALWKSTLQKAVRRGWVEKAMYAAWKLCRNGHGWDCWRRLRIIAVEDCGQPDVIVAVFELWKEAWNRKYREGMDWGSWDQVRLAMTAAKILAESPKDRRVDEFMELLRLIEKKADEDEELARMRAELESVPDVAKDMHTKDGRKMGRDNEFWAREASRCERMTEAYAEWREWWEGLMLRKLEEGVWGRWD